MHKEGDREGERDLNSCRHIASRLCNAVTARPPLTLADAANLLQ